MRQCRVETDCESWVVAVTNATGIEQKETATTLTAFSSPPTRSTSIPSLIIEFGMGAGNGGAATREFLTVAVAGDGALWRTED